MTEWQHQTKRIRAGGDKAEPCYTRLRPLFCPQKAMPRTFFLFGSLFAFFGVAAGAFGAHSLKAMLQTEMLIVFETAVRYQMYHALALYITGWASQQYQHVALRAAGWLFVLGIVLFSGSLYVLAFSGARWLGALTPLGGLAFLAGWALLGWGCWKSRWANT